MNMFTKSQWDSTRVRQELAEPTKTSETRFAFSWPVLVSRSNGNRFIYGKSRVFSFYIKVLKNFERKKMENTCNTASGAEEINT